MTKPKLDTEGYLIHTSDWSPEVAEYLAAQTGIKLTPYHWEILNALRDYYNNFQHTPSQRPFIKYMIMQYGKEKGSNFNLMKLFSGKPAREAARIAGLPKPPNCF